MMQVKIEGDIHQGVAYYKKALLYNWHYADAMYNLGVAYGELLKFDMVIFPLLILSCSIIFTRFSYLSYNYQVEILSIGLHLVPECNCNRMEY